MIPLKLGFGILFLFIGWVYLYKSTYIFKFNKFAREKLFNDRLVLIYGKKLATLFFCLSMIALYMGSASFVRKTSNKGQRTWVFETNHYLMYSAMQDFYANKLEKAAKKYLIILQNDPKNTFALKKLAYTYEASGKTIKAKQTFKKLLALSTNEDEKKEVLKKLKGY